MSSGLLLMRLTGDVKIWYFSVKHKLHLLEPFQYCLAWSVTDQCMAGFLMPFPFISQKCLDNSVKFALLSYFKELRCLKNRSLNIFSVRSLYVTPSLVVFSFKMHWYINSWSKQSFRTSIFLLAITFRLIFGFLFRQDSVFVWFYHVAKIR